MLNHRRGGLSKLKHKDGASPIRQPSRPNSAHLFGPLPALVTSNMNPGQALSSVNLRSAPLLVQSILSLSLATLFSRFRQRS